jgi:hypothetical protein
VTAKAPFNHYIVANIFAPGVNMGVIDTKTKEGIGIFCVSQREINMPLPHSVHMRFWLADGLAVIIGNLIGK